ncbi:hypothetical protein EMIT0111MI5_300036 [Burkholderia sp. IT-111MI5]
MERTCECPKSLVGQGVRSAVWPSQTSDERRRHTGDFGHSRDMIFLNLGVPRERPLARRATPRILMYSQGAQRGERPFSWQRMRVPYVNRP